MDQRFQKPFTREELADGIEAWLATRPWLNAEAIPPILDALISEAGGGIAFRAVMKTKPPKSWLTEAGRQSGYSLWNIVQAVCAHTTAIARRRQQLASARHMSGTFPWTKVSIVQDGANCAQCELLEGQIYRVGEGPHFPLPGCDALHCRCMYITVTDRQRSRYVF